MPNKFITENNPDLQPMRTRHIRQIKPQYFESDTVAEMSIVARYSFLGLLTSCDFAGRFAWKPRVLKTQILPYDDVDFEIILDELKKHERVRKYEVDGKEYGEILNFRAHQAVHPHEINAGSPNPEPLPADSSF
jgi:hypothetical protein